MINLYYSNGQILLYDVEDWITLRKEYRIIGEMIGNSLHLSSLPIKILPEEACLLMEKNLISILETPREIFKSESDKRKLKEYENHLLEAQTKEYKKIRKEQLETLADKIIAKQNVDRSKEDIVNDELKKFPDVTTENMIWPTKVSATDCTMYQNLKRLNLNDIVKLTTPLKRAVYSDLWNRGYYITQGHKFGGHFLVYLGDPVCYHAIFIVRCIDLKSHIFPLDFISFGRLGTSVKKKSVWASLIDNNVSYVTMSWIDS